MHEHDGEAYLSTPLPPASYSPSPATFRRGYQSLLAELEVNSRPIIQSLTTVAEDFTRYAGIVVQCIEVHIRRVPLSMKLPAFYLLDAVSKNVFDPYASAFSASVVQLFLETYGQADQQIRTKMEEMLLTWRSGSPTGSQLFGTQAQAAIERVVCRDDGLGPLSSQPPTVGGWCESRRNQVSVAPVLVELEYIIGWKEHALQANPADTTSQNHINILHQVTDFLNPRPTHAYVRQLRKLIEAGGVSQEELQQILAQLRTLMRSVFPSVVSPCAATPQPVALLPIAIAAPAAVAWSKQYLQLPLAPSDTTYDVVKTNPPTPVPGPGIVVQMAEIRGVAKTESGDAAAVVDGTAKQPDCDLQREASRRYEDAILAQDVKLTTADITRKHSGIIVFICSRFASKCNQCGLRVLGAEDGPEMTAHRFFH